MKNSLLPWFRQNNYQFNKFKNLLLFIFTFVLSGIYWACFQMSLVINTLIQAYFDSKKEKKLIYSIYLFPLQNKIDSHPKIAPPSKQRTPKKQNGKLSPTPNPKGANKKRNKTQSITPLKSSTKQMSQLPSHLALYK